jgi:REP element-mobilizing transposase RayT
MVRGIEKRRIVDDETDRRNFVRRLGALAEETRTPIYAWALMSNHVHILLCSGALGLAKFMRRLLTGYAVSYTCAIAGMGMSFRTGTNRLSATAIAISPNWCATFT